LYEIKVSAHFDAAHFLRDYEGPCARMHGHTWRVEAAVAGEELGRGQLLVDFHHLRSLLREVVSAFDHRCLNELEPFTELSPTSENIARVVFRRLGEKLEGLPPGARLSWVSVAESPDTAVVYREEE